MKWKRFTQTYAHKNQSDDVKMPMKWNQSRKKEQFISLLESFARTVNRKLVQSTHKWKCRCRRLNVALTNTFAYKRIRDSFQQSEKITHESECWQIENCPFIIIGNIKKEKEWKSVIHCVCEKARCYFSTALAFEAKSMRWASKLPQSTTYYYYFFCIPFGGVGLV